MSPLVSILWSLARALVQVALGWIVAKGLISKDQADKATPELVSFLVLAVMTVVTVAHAQWQKYKAGLLVKKITVQDTKTLTVPIDPASKISTRPTQPPQA